MKALFAAVALAAALASSPAPAEEPKFVEVIGGGGVPLNAVNWGNPNGPAILFIHAYSQSYVNFSPQLDDPDLAKQFNMVAFDLRGHGASAKPWTKEDYADMKLWADDVAAVIKAFNLKKTTMVAWSFGGNVAMDYVRHYGVKDLAGINFVGTIAGFGVRPAPETSGAAAKPRYSRLSSDIRSNVLGMPGLVDILTVKRFPPEYRELMMMSNAMTPSYVRRLLLNHPWGNDDLLPQMTVPLLLSTGDHDQSVKMADVVALQKRLPTSALSIYKDAGPSPFYEDAPRFNRELAAFVTAANK